MTLHDDTSTIGVVSNSSNSSKLPLWSKEVNVEIWFERFELSVEKHKIKEEEWTREAFLVMYEEAYTLAKNLRISIKTDYNTAREKLCFGLIKRVSRMEYQQEFNARCQKEGENAEDYSDDLRRLVNFHISTRKGRESDILLVKDSENFSNVLGLDGIKALKLDLNKIFQCNHICNLNLTNLTREITSQYRRLFDESRLGTSKYFKAILHLKKDSTRKFSKTRSITYALYHMVKEELNRLVQKGTIEQVETNEWSFPMVVVPKPNGDLRICVDLRAGLNCQLDIEQYPIATM
ncbi:hypothetical protein RF11_15436 [Thelohanellus kitauei]|uniref:Uncharacterized protein n=1 Tax=Thelohanellus kitauei TaxID=669202 RepID=A0A0C2MJA7_THEKT|nr:hypothetical protein RF11_15436 [Thelohanellus kitauei]